MTIFTFSDAIEELDGDFAFEIANGLRPPEMYKFSDILPDLQRTTYKVENGTMTIRPTMAGVTGMDSPYAKTGHTEISTFLERTAKITNEVTFPERALRELQRAVQTLDITQARAKERVVQAVFNFTSKVLVQSHIDTAEYLRGQALQYGEIDWTFGDISLTVDYGIPNDHVFNTRTGSQAYMNSDSLWWDDHRKAQRRLGFNMDAVYMHLDTLHAIIDNPANDVQVVQQEENVFDLTQLKRDENDNRTELQSNDVRDRATVVTYQEQGEIIDPENPEQTKQIDFMEPGRVFWVGNDPSESLRIGVGATEPPEADFDLGYTHLGPTVEGNGQPGRWANVYTPEDRPWQLTGQGVQNMLPVIENPEKLVISSTEMP